MVSRVTMLLIEGEPPLTTVTTVFNLSDCNEMSFVKGMAVEKQEIYSTCVIGCSHPS